MQYPWIWLVKILHSFSDEMVLLLLEMVSSFQKLFTVILFNPFLISQVEIWSTKKETPILCQERPWCSG